MAVEHAVFAACALICLGGSLGVIWSRNPVHSALSLVATLFGIAVLFLNQNAPFLAAVQVIVYTGAIVVLILFVIMLLGVDQAEDVDTEPLVGQRIAAAIVSFGLAALLVGTFWARSGELVTGTPAANRAIDESAPNVEQLGRSLFTDWVFSVELTAVLLTIAVVGAVVLARRPRDVEPMPEPESMEPEAVSPADDEGGH